VSIRAREGGAACQGSQLSISLESLMRDTIIGTPRPSVATELVSFLLVGGLAALSFAALSTVLIEQRTGLPDWVMSALCYAAFIVPVYFAHRRISFRSTTPHGVALPRYIAVQVSALTLASAFSYLCYSVLGLPSIAASVLVIGLTSGVNFLVLRLWAFAVGR
jgi:putative flippase GtrA